MQASLVAQLVKNLPAVQETLVWFPGREDPLEKGYTTHSSILELPWWLRWLRICLQCRRPWFNPWVGMITWRKAWKPTLIFLHGELPWTEEPGGVAESDTTEWLKHSIAYIYMADSCWCMVETNTTLGNNYPPVKKKKKNRIWHKLVRTY